MPSRRSVHTAAFDTCVRKVKASAKRYRRTVNPYAVCMAALGERKAVKSSHRRR